MIYLARRQLLLHKQQPLAGRGSECGMLRRTFTEEVGEGVVRGASSLLSAAGGMVEPDSYLRGVNRSATGGVMQPDSYLGSALSRTARASASRRDGPQVRGRYACCLLAHVVH